MQTFFPLPTPEESARVLDLPRYRKQLIEFVQLDDVLTGVSTAWAGHPAVRMWQGHRTALVYAGMVFALGYADRTGLRHASAAVLLERWAACEPRPLASTVVWPRWMGDAAVHGAYRAALRRKGWEDALWEAWRGRRRVWAATHAQGQTEAEYALWLATPATKKNMLPRHWAALAEALEPGPNYYDQFGWTEPMMEPSPLNRLPYPWPEA